MPYKKMIGQIGAMLDGGTEADFMMDEEEVKDVQAAEGQTNEESDDNSVGDSADNGDNPAGDEPTPDDITTSDAGADTVDDFKKPLLEQNQRLQAELDALKASKTEAQPLEVEKDLEEEEIFKDLVDDLGLDEVGGKKLAAIFKLAMGRAQTQAVDAALKATPATIQQTLQTREALGKVRDKFYETNPILDEYKAMVAQTANMIARENPDLTYDKILTQSADRCYKALGITAEVREKFKGLKSDAASEAGKARKPAFAASSGARKPLEKKSKFEEERDAMLALEY